LIQAEIGNGFCAAIQLFLRNRVKRILGGNACIDCAACKFPDVN